MLLRHSGNSQKGNHTQWYNQLEGTADAHIVVRRDKKKTKLRSGPWPPISYIAEPVSFVLLCLSSPMEGRSSRPPESARHLSGLRERCSPGRTVWTRAWPSRGMLASRGPLPPKQGSKLPERLDQDVKLNVIIITILAHTACPHSQRLTTSCRTKGWLHWASFGNGVSPAAAGRRIKAQF
jgi:hypothetical protein